MFYEYLSNLSFGVKMIPPERDGHGLLFDAPSNWYVNLHLVRVQSIVFVCMGNSES